MCVYDRIYYIWIHGNRRISLRCIDDLTIIAVPFHPIIVQLPLGIVIKLSDYSPGKQSTYTATLVCISTTSIYVLFYFVNIKFIALFEYHPFSIARIQNNQMIFYIKCMPYISPFTPWTLKLFNLVNKLNSTTSIVTNSSITTSVPEYFIDRSYEGFERILNIRNVGEISMEGLNGYELRTVRNNLEFFNISQLRKVPTTLDYTSGINIEDGRSTRDLEVELNTMISLDDGRLSVGNSDGDVRMIDIDGSIDGNHLESVHCFALLSGGRLCSGSDDSTIKIRNTSTGQCERTLVGHARSVLSICVLSGNRICSGSYDNTIKVRNVQSGECEITLVGHSNAIKSLVKLADGRICSGSKDLSIKIWNLETGNCEVTLTGHISFVFVVTQLMIIV